MNVAGLAAGVGVSGAAEKDAAWKAKLADGAHQFESMMLEQLMKPLKFGGTPGSGQGVEGGGDDDEDPEGDAGAEIVRGFGTQALAKAISSGGAFGIAAQVIRQVTAEHESLAEIRDSTKVG